MKADSSVFFSSLKAVKAYLVLEACRDILGEWADPVDGEAVDVHVVVVEPRVPAWPQRLRLS